VGAHRPGATESERLNEGGPDFDALVGSIVDVHERLHHQATKAVNTALTLRNWLIGCYVHDYELAGRDRAIYGLQLVDRLAERLGERGIPRTDARELRRYRLFFLMYPRIRETLSPELVPALSIGDAGGAFRESPTLESGLTGADVLGSFSFSHIVEFLGIDDSIQRAFYETQVIAGQWSVRQLRRQIASLLYERTGLSRDKAAAIEHARVDTAAGSLAGVIRDPYVFEFLGLKPTEVMGESHLEDALLDKVQAFLLELGRGFCFEARQKRIGIGGEHFFVDLVFYHRLLKCHVLIELKVDEFRHEHLGQLNNYVNWYRRNGMAAGDNPPIGLLLCTRKNHALIEYALAGMDNQLFVSKYLLVLPDREEMRTFIEAQLGHEGISD